ncbi:MAG: hypothetical protein R3247_16460, partial [Rhodothermales bacterium]|nr:hypothetical protein [Rhodothermales bacterium]
MLRLLPALLIAVLAAGCAAPEVFVAEGHRGWRDLLPPTDETYRVVLLGDGGHAPTDAAVLDLLRTYLAGVGERGAVVFLGDNAHPAGLPDSAAAARAEAEARLHAQLDAVRDFPGRIVVLPGEQDWGPGGRDALARQEAFVEAYLDRGDTFLPDDGFPGPTAVELADGVTLIALDTQWWLADDRPTGDAGDYTLREPSDFLLELEDLLYRYRDDRILIAGHHPLLSNGLHAGRVPWTAHLTPLPLLGSVVPLYRRFVGREQDLAHADYRLLRRELRTLFAGRDGLVYAAGHDRSLQYFPVVERRRQLHYLVSGSAAGAEHVAAGHGAVFTAQRPGFLALRYFADRSVWLEAWTPGDGEGRLLFREQIEEAEPDPAPDPTVTASDGLPDFRDSTVVRAVEPGYARGGLRNVLLGRHHRDLWATPIEVPVLDAARTAGGLTPIKVGGQSQSVTMRLAGGDGKIYMLRSIDKVAGRNWPPALRRTVATSLAQDQIAMLHPFGALLMPALSDAAGVYHTNPRLVFVPDDPRLGPQRNALVGEVVLFEIRPDEDLSDLDYVGNASNVIGSTKLFDEITDDNDHRVDARAFARARLLDMLVADWDRTADNFRWSAFEPYERDPSLEGDARTEGKVYVPVPRDRDAAFTRIDGLLPRLYQRLAERVWQDFDADYGYLKGLNKKGLPLDRRFTAALTRDDWVGLAEEIRERLTDDVLAQAVAAWPAPVRAQAGAETLRILQARRDRLPDVAAKHYALLARVVDVVGSDKHERFEVTRQADGRTDVVVFKTSKKGETRKELYRRTFRPGETREIRLYGLGGRDRFEVGGEGRSGIRLIAVGGPGDDAFAVQDPAGRTRLYDAPAGTHVETAEGAAVRLRPDPLVNRYDLDGYQPNQTQPVAFFGSNTDDGVFAGGGVKITRHGFRKAPHAQTHRIMGNYAVRTNAFNLRYA